MKSEPVVMANSEFSPREPRRPDDQNVFESAVVFDAARSWPISSADALSTIDSTAFDAAPLVGRTDAGNLIDAIDTPARDATGQWMSNIVAAKQL